jgi:hypothetical protein
MADVETKSDENSPTQLLFDSQRTDDEPEQELEPEPFSQLSYDEDGGPTSDDFGSTSRKQPPKPTYFPTCCHSHGKKHQFLMSKWCSVVAVNVDRHRMLVHLPLRGEDFYFINKSYDTLQVSISKVYSNINFLSKIIYDSTKWHAHVVPIHCYLLNVL